MHGNLRRFMPEGRDRMAMELGPGTTVEAFLVSLGAAQDTWLVAVNGTTVAKDQVLAPGDQLDCFEPVAAG
jgi:sulfur carrier protein ThiS